MGKSFFFFRNRFGRLCFLSELFRSKMLFCRKFSGKKCYFVGSFSGKSNFLSELFFEFRQKIAFSKSSSDKIPMPRFITGNPKLRFIASMKIVPKLPLFTQASFRGYLGHCDVIIAGKSVNYFESYSHFPCHLPDIKHK